jgi:hypothetical protein
VSVQEVGESSGSRRISWACDVDVCGVRLITSHSPYARSCTTQESKEFTRETSESSKRCQVCAGHVSALRTTPSIWQPRLGHNPKYDWEK